MITRIKENEVFFSKNDLDKIAKSCYNKEENRKEVR